MNRTKPGAVFDLEYFFEMSPDLICITGYDGFFKKINPAVSKTLGYSEEELLASPVDTFVYPEDREITADKRRKLINDEPLLNFENRYLSRSGSVVWLTWTSVPIKRDQVIFAIAKNITYRKQLEEYERISDILEMIHDDHSKRFKKQLPVSPKKQSSAAPNDTIPKAEEPSHADQLWLNKFEAIVRKHTGKLHLNLEIIADEMAMSERHLHRHVQRILGITPNKLVRVIRLQLAWEAIATGKYRTITEISNLAGYSSRGHFSKLFKDIYGINVAELL
ncbi:PAS domain S-box protein [Mucilaginibacter pedocola]|uniref:Diguanylate cyclase n=1 Tax=Mucilaginibacter pedocola TaxID=1792845 RepID=A0A1S9P6M4_9SPHI|nr:PAS domain S-box protein [Mucilaginibacter pedocola]OOQ56595.1 diguanylate cyclase [Mucilaginibacter pedocola]